MAAVPRCRIVYYTLVYLERLARCPGTEGALRLSGSVAGAARSAGENSLLKESFRLQPDHRKNCVYPERALDLGNTGGNRANPSPTRPPDLCAIPVISLTVVPQQQRDWEIIGADTLLGACPAGAQCITADAGSDGKRR